MSHSVQVLKSGSSGIDAAIKKLGLNISDIPSSWSLVCIQDKQEMVAVAACYAHSGLDGAQSLVVDQLMADSFTLEHDLLNYIAKHGAEIAGSPIQHVKTLANTIPAEQAPSGEGNAFAHPVHHNEFRYWGQRLVKWIAEYYESRVSTFPVRSEVEPGYLRTLLPETAPVEAESVGSVLADVEKHILPGITHWQSPNFFAYYPANSSYPGILGDMISDCFNCIGFSWINSPACTELESITMDWVAKAMDLPSSMLSTSTGGGSIQGTASEAVVVTMLAAKQRLIMKLKNSGAYVSDEDVSNRMVAYGSSQSHSCFKKACMILGIPENRTRLIDVCDGDYAMDLEHLKSLVARDEENGLLPFYVMGNVGTTSSCAMDPIAELGLFCHDRDVWFHVDAAYAGSALMCPEFREEYFPDASHVDSFCFNAHKWMLVNFDCSLLYVTQRKFLIEALSVDAEYLRNKASESGQVIDFRDWQLPLGRRFRSLKLWFVLRMYGLENIRKYLRHHVSLAERFEHLVRDDDRFELVCKRRLGLVCFRLRPCADATEDQYADLNAKLRDTVNSSGKTFIIHTSLKGKFTLRFAVGGVRQQWSNVSDAWQVISECADALLENK